MDTTRTIIDSTYSSHIPWHESSYWGTFWGQFLIELLGGTIAAFLFLFLVLYTLKPKIKIAPFLGKIQNPAPGFYIFKFVNKSFFSAHEVKVELYKIRKIPAGGGNHSNEHEKITIINGNITHIPKRPFWWWQKRKDHPHCIVVRSPDNLNEILQDDLNGILLRVSLKHGLTGLAGVYEQEYGNEDDIRNGRFKSGPKFD